MRGAQPVARQQAREQHGEQRPQRGDADAPRPAAPASAPRNRGRGSRTGRRRRAPARPRRPQQARAARAATAASAITTPPTANTMAVVWKGGIGPLSAVRLASVAHSRMAPAPERGRGLCDDMAPLPLPQIRHLPRCARAGAQALMSRHAARNHRHAENRPGPAQPRGRRPRRQRRQAAQGARRGRRHGRRPRRLLRAVHHRLSARGPGAQAGLCGGRARQRSRRWRPRPADGGPGVHRRHHLGRGRQALQRGGAAGRRPRRRACASRSTCPTTACSTRSACSTSGPMPGPVELPRRAHRRADLRGHLEGGGVRVPAGDGLGDADLAQRLAVRLAQARPAHERRRGARDGDRAAAASTSTRSAARTSWCSTAPPSCSTPTASLAVQLPAWEEAVTRRRDAAHAAAAGAASRARAPCIEEQRRGRLPRLHAGPARLRRQERLSRRRAGPVGRHRLGAGRGAGGRRAGPRARALRDAALPLHLQREPRRCRRLRQGAGRALRHRADRRAGRGLRARRWPRCSRAARPTSPRRTSRAACAAPR